MGKSAAWHTEDVKAIMLYYPAFSIVDDMKKHYPTPDVMPGQDHGFNTKGKVAAAEMTYGFLKEQVEEK